MHFCAVNNKFVIVASLLFGRALLSQCQSKIDFSYEIPSVEFGALLTLDENSVLFLANTLVTVGIIQITSIPQINSLRKSAFENLPVCLSKSDTLVSKEMTDGSLRLTTQSASIHGVPGIMSTNCGDSSAKLRAAVDATTRQLFLALDKASAFVGGDNKVLPLMTPYKSYNDLMHRGEHLEHLHSYLSGPENVDNDSTQPIIVNTIDFHTDAGLLIAMTTGYYSGGEASEESGLFIQLPTGVKARAVVQDDALIIMVGEGGARWLAPILGAPLRAVPHALVADLKKGSGATRSWYGKMYLPPSDAIVPSEGVTFQQYQMAQSNALARIGSHSRSVLPADTDVLPSACGGVHSVYGALTSSTECTASDGGEGIMCWMQCMSVASLPCGSAAMCTNPTTGALSDGDKVTCPACKPQCPAVKASPPHDESNVDKMIGSYCYGTGVSMFMQGFTSMTGSRMGNTACLTFLVSWWILNSRLKFAAACLGSLLMGFAVHWLSKLRHDMCKANSGKSANWKFSLLLLGLHSAQVLLGYLLMLIAMTYSVELFCMVWLGLTAGYGAFNLQLTPDLNVTDPCCSEEFEDDSSPAEKVTSSGSLLSRTVLGEKTRLRDGDSRLSLYSRAEVSDSNL